MAGLGIYKHHLAIPRLAPRSLQLEIRFLRIYPHRSVCSSRSAPSSWWNSQLLVATSFIFYINVVNFGTEWEIFFNGVSQNTYNSTSTGFANCTYQSSSSVQSQVAISPNITVLVHGSDGLSASESFSFEVNNMMLVLHIAACICTYFLNS